MIIYNVTVKIENSVADKWLDWMRSVHVPDVMKTGFFSKSQISRVISVHDTDGVTFSIQYHCASTSDLHKYQIQHAPKLQKEHTEKYKDKFVAFRSIMEVIE